MRGGASVRGQSPRPLTDRASKDARISTGYAGRGGFAPTASAVPGLDPGNSDRGYSHPCAARPANSRSPASRLERKSLSAVAASAPSTLESCQPRWRGVGEPAGPARPIRRRPTRSHRASTAPPRRRRARPRAGRGRRTGAPSSGCRRSRRRARPAWRRSCRSRSSSKTPTRRAGAAASARPPKLAAQPISAPQEKARPSTACGQDVTRFISG